MQTAVTGQTELIPRQILVFTAHSVSTFIHATSEDWPD